MVLLSGQCEDTSVDKDNILIDPPSSLLKFLDSAPGIELCSYQRPGRGAWHSSMLMPMCTKGIACTPEKPSCPQLLHWVQLDRLEPWTVVTPMRALQSGQASELKPCQAPQPQEQAAKQRPSSHVFQIGNVPFAPAAPSHRCLLQDRHMSQAVNFPVTSQPQRHGQAQEPRQILNVPV